MKKSRYIVGIDLGTTTTSLSYIDTLDKDSRPQGFPILQWEKEGSTIEDFLLPSFCYVAQKKEVKNKKFLLPCYEDSKSVLSEGAFVLGRYAQTLQQKIPSRVIHSAKSWLCHGGVNREDKILPWNSDDLIGAQRYSPVETLSFLLTHLRLCWNHEMALHEDDYKLENQQVTITVPASFSEVAIRLTLRAAALAGFSEENLRLVEEPQAAFYFWANELLSQKQKKQVFLDKLPGLAKGSQKVLVCDIGGGTSDFSLFDLNLSKDQSDLVPLKIKRIAVSRHILLGGDNLDLKIASLFEESYQQKFQKKLSSTQWAEVSSAVRQIKEKVLAKSEGSTEELFLSLTGSSRNIFTGSQTVSLSEAKVFSELLEGFFPPCQKNLVAEIYDESAVQEWNLPYAKNPAFTHHLSQFLKGEAIDGVLFVGGTLIPEVLRARLLETIKSWQETAPVILNQEVFALSVSKGAADFGLSFSRQDRIKIKAGYPRSLYLEVDRTVNGLPEKQLLCVVPKGYDKRDEKLTLPDLSFKLALNQAVAFNLYQAEDYRSDKLGALVAPDHKNFSLLAPIETELRTEKKSKALIDVALQVELNSLGVLKLSFLEQGVQARNWPLEFNVQESSLRKTSAAGVVQAKVGSGAALQKATDLLLSFFGKGKNKAQEKPKASKILQDLSTILDEPKQDWNLSVLRKLLDVLLKNQGARGRSPAHESTWYNLCGYFFRPGYGHSLDSLRIQDLWKVFQQGPMHQDLSQVQNEWWVLWRRVAGGLSREQQNKIFDKIFPHVRQKKASAEMIMTLGALEGVEANKKIILGNFLVGEILGGDTTLYVEQRFWTLTRLACRFPLVTGPENILRPSFVEKWFDQLAELPQEKKRKLKSLLLRYYLYSGRMVDDREFDLGPELRLRYQKELSAMRVDDETMKPVLNYVEVAKQEKANLLSESLPSGLLLN